MTYQIVDWLMTYIECFVMLVVVTESGGRKFEEKKQAYLLLSFSLFNAILVAVYLTHTLYRHCPLSEEKRPVFVYGFELSLSTLSSILSIILLSIIFKNVYSSLLFLYIFFFLRLFSGGYHAPTYSRCFILTNAIFAFVYLLSEVIQWYKPLLIPFAILSCISIFLLSPIRSTKHPLSERLYAQNKKAARIIVSIDFLLFLILYITGMPTRYLATWALSLSAVAIMMVITLFEKNSTRRESV